MERVCKNLVFRGVFEAVENQQMIRRINMKMCPIAEEVNSTKLSLVMAKGVLL